MRARDSRGRFVKSPEPMSTHAAARAIVHGFFTADDYLTAISEAKQAGVMTVRRRRRRVSVPQEWPLYLSACVLAVALGLAVGWFA